ncbi:MAG: hypothetical protein ACREA3_08420 [Nitrosotalea sp.]
MSLGDRYVLLITWGLRREYSTYSQIFIRCSKKHPLLDFHGPE